MSRHTTSFTTDPRYRARQEVRNRLQRLAQEATTTADCMGAFGENPETAMWREVVTLASTMVEGLNVMNEVERQNKIVQAADSRNQQAGHDIQTMFGQEPS